jgi:hypothetical protein
MLCARVNAFVPSVACGHYQTWLSCRRVLSVRLSNCTLGWTVQLLQSPSLPFSLCWANRRYFGHQTPVTPRLISSKDQVNVCTPFDPASPRSGLMYCHVTHARGGLFGSAFLIGGVPLPHGSVYHLRLQFNDISYKISLHLVKSFGCYDWCN